MTERGARTYFPFLLEICGKIGYNLYNPREPGRNGRFAEAAIRRRIRRCGIIAMRLALQQQKIKGNG